MTIATGVALSGGDDDNMNFPHEYHLQNGQFESPRMLSFTKSPMATVAPTKSKRRKRISVADRFVNLGRQVIRKMSIRNEKRIRLNAVPC